RRADEQARQHLEGYVVEPDKALHIHVERATNGRDRLLEGAHAGGKLLLALRSHGADDRELLIVLVEDNFVALCHRSGHHCTVSSRMSSAVRRTAVSTASIDSFAL